MTPCCDLGTQGHPSIELFPGVYIMTVPNGENIRTAFVEGSKKNCPLYRQILSIYAQIWRLTLTIDLHHSFNLCKLIRMQICTYISNLNLLWQIMSVFAILEDLTLNFDLYHSFNLWLLIRAPICTYILNLNLLWQILSIFAFFDNEFRRISTYWSIE